MLSVLWLTTSLVAAENGTYDWRDYNESDAYGAPSDPHAPTSAFPRISHYVNYQPNMEGTLPGDIVV
jgi:hypothetical protein